MRNAWRKNGNCLCCKCKFVCHHPLVIFLYMEQALICSYTSILTYIHAAVHCNIVPLKLIQPPGVKLCRTFITIGPITIISFFSPLMTFPIMWYREAGKMLTKVVMVYLNQRTPSDFFFAALKSLICKQLR